MNFKDIYNCSEYFNYGKINSKIIATTFRFEPDAYNYDFSCLAERIIQNSQMKKIFLFFSKRCTYPISTKVKYLGLWKPVEEEYGISLYKKHEHSVRLERFYLLIGMAEFRKEDLCYALNLLCKDFMHAYIVLSNREDFDSLLENKGGLLLSCKDYTVDFEYCINNLCIKSEVITALSGYDGLTINHFKVSGSMSYN